MPVPVPLGAATKLAVDTAGQHGYSVVAIGPNRFRLTRRERRRTTLGLTSVLKTGEMSIAEDRRGVHVRLTGDAVGRFDEDLRAVVGTAPEPSRAVPTRRVEAALDVNGHIDLRAVLGGVQDSPRTPAAGLSAVPGMAPPNSLAVAMPAPTADALVDDGSEATIAAVRAAVMFPDGRYIPVAQGITIGRNPVQPPEVPRTALITVDDPSLSKTHATLLPMRTGVWVIDHHSTNGTNTMRDGVPTVCPGGQRVPVSVGTVIVAGELHLQVTR